MFWGDYYGSFKDKFGVHWMFNCTEKNNSCCVLRKKIGHNLV